MGVEIPGQAAPAAVQPQPICQVMFTLMNDGSVVTQSSTKDILIVTKTVGAGLSGLCDQIKREQVSKQVQVVQPDGVLDKFLKNLN